MGLFRFLRKSLSPGNGQPLRLVARVDQVQIQINEYSEHRLIWNARGPDLRTLEGSLMCRIVLLQSCAHPDSRIGAC